LIDQPHFKENKMELKPIGIIHSPYKERRDAPRQGRLSDQESTIEIYPEFAQGLNKIEKLSHIFVLYWGDRADRSVVQSPTPFSREPIGVFATRSPNRPNPIALCIADLLEISGRKLVVRGVDALDGSQVLDIKVYSSGIDSVPDAKSWQFPNHRDNLPPEERPNA
jgi:tRNA-Thr(GGU) m(6)t(6)A37 methyltransferase TsaA